MQIQADLIFIALKSEVKGMDRNLSSHGSSLIYNSQGAEHKDTFMWIHEPLTAHITLSKFLIAFVVSDVWFYTQTAFWESSCFSLVIWIIHSGKNKQYCVIYLTKWQIFISEYLQWTVSEWAVDLKMIHGTHQQMYLPAFENITPGRQHLSRKKVILSK